MSRLEFITIENKEELKHILRSLIKKEEYIKTYKDKDNLQKHKIICKNGRLYLGNNYSISLSKDNNNKYYMGIDYLSADDRIKLKNNNSFNKEEKLSYDEDDLF